MLFSITQGKKRGRPSTQQLLKDEQEKLMKNPKRSSISSFFKSADGKVVKKPMLAEGSSTATSSNLEKEEFNTDQDISDLRQTIKVLEKENKNLKFEVMHLKEQSKKKN